MRLRHALLIVSFLLVACGDDEPPSLTELAFSTPVQGIDPALLALVALDPERNDLLAVGGPLVGSGSPTIYRRGENDSFSTIDPPSGWDGAIWWGWAASESDVWLVGDNAQIARGSPDNWEIQPTPAVETSSGTTFYGVWGSGPDDVWVVGGEPRRPSGPRGYIFHWDGNTLDEVVPTGTASTSTGAVVFKVWGADADNVMFVGSRGLAIFYDGSNWIKTDTGVTAQLTTVHGRSANDFVAVGGLNNGIVLRFDGTFWTDISPMFAPALNGVFVTEAGTIWVGGNQTYLNFNNGGGFSQDPINTGLGGAGAFHAVYVAGDGTVFGAGGILALEDTPRQGLIGRYGK